VAWDEISRPFACLRRSGAADLIGQATVIDGNAIEIHGSAFGFGPSTHQRPANPGSGSVGKFQECPKTLRATVDEDGHYFSSDHIKSSLHPILSGDRYEH